MATEKITLSQLKKKAIIDAAITEFQEKGFQSASMDNIAQYADVSKRTVYNHFASKEILFERVIGELINLLCVFEELKYEKDQPIREQLVKLAEEEIKLLTSTQAMAGAKMFVREALNNPNIVASAMEQLELQILPINSWFKQACETGGIKSDQSQFVSDQFIAVIKGFCFWPQLINGCLPPDETRQQLIIDTVVDMIIKQYVD